LDLGGGQRPGKPLQLAWIPVEAADADTVKATYAGLFENHGPPLILNSDNGGPFRDEGTKQLLTGYDMISLFNPLNPRRRPAYNGGVERANGQLAGYQEAVAALHGRGGLAATIMDWAQVPLPLTLRKDPQAMV
jgi:hypothetical protein